MTKEDILLRKRITAILRHNKKWLNSRGWISIYRLAQIMNVSIRKVRELVKTDAERYEYVDKYNKVRVKRGHTNGVRIEGSFCEPPEIMYYGVKMSKLGSVLEHGSKGMVHLVDVRKYARNGIERNNSVILSVKSGKMYRDGFTFCKSIYDEWYVDNIPAEYIYLIA